ncbi:hypothetical protein PV326_011576 [Microctonus aethiopoides]|nr:hypothetical protein PV326_011576 [Microctonus aethiopoides]
MLAGQMPKLVNKQFNSPINLYSPQNIQETLDRQTKILSNGAVGIDFNQLAKPANLQNSAVLRMLEEEEARQRNGEQPGLKRIAWPPPPEDHQDIEYIEQSPIQAKTRGVGEYASYQGSISSGSSPQPPHFDPQQRHQQQQQQQQQYNQPQHQTNLKPWTPSVQTPPSTSPISLNASNTWMPLSQHQQQSSSALYATTPRSYQPTFEPPPTTITLRPEPPISQTPAPVYQAQPAATMVPSMGGNMRGDLKWPPESVKHQTEMENLARLELAKGPAVRPRRVNKDYSGFFAQHALNSTYPGYRAPPGTQYFTPSYHQ